MVDQDLAALCHREHGRILGMLILQTGDRALAEELTQDALVRLCEKWPSVRRHERPGAWLATVAMNLANSAHRRRSAERRAKARQSNEPTPAPFEPADVLAVRAAVAELPRRRRTAIILRYYGQLSVAETAQAMSIAEGTVRALTSQAMDTLRTSGLVENEEVSS